MIQEIELNGVKVKVEITKEMARKVLEEFEGSDEIQIGEKYISRGTDGVDYTYTWDGSNNDSHRMESDNCFHNLKVTIEKLGTMAAEYFNKRDARRAAETKLRKIIGDINKKDGFVVRFDGTQENYFTIYLHTQTAYFFYSCSTYQTLPTWRYSSRATAEFINENHADLLKVYLEIE